MTDLPLTVPDLLTLTGMTGLLYLLTATVHSAQLLPSRRFLPILAMALGSGLGALAALSSGQNVPDAVLLGVVSGALSSGVEETRKGLATATGSVRDALANKRIEKVIAEQQAVMDELVTQFADDDDSFRFTEEDDETLTGAP